MLKGTPFTVRYHNTVHGFNPSTGHIVIGFVNHFVPTEKCKFIKEVPHLKRACYQCDSCMIHRKSLMEYSALERILREESGIESITLDDYLGRDYIQVDIKDRDAIPDIINATVKYGFTVRLQTRLNDVIYYPGEIFSLEASELKFVDVCMKILHEGLIKRLMFEDCCTTEIIGDERLWKSEKGKEFARFILSRNPQIQKALEEPLYLLALNEQNSFCEAIDFPLISTRNHLGEPLTPA